MKNKLSKIVLLISVISIISVNIIIAVSNQEKGKLIDILGNKDKLSDMNIVFIKGDGIYNTKEVIIDKDDVQVNQNAFNYSSVFDSEDREVLINNKELKDMIYGVSIYQDENSVGTVSSYENYGMSDGEEEKTIRNYEIVDKNLSDNKIKEYKFSIETDYDMSSSIYYQQNAFKFNNEIYIQNIIEIGGTHDENEIYSAFELSYDIYKINLEKEEIELVNSMKLEKGNSEILRSQNDKVISYENRLFNIASIDGVMNVITYDIINNKFTANEIKDLKYDPEKYYIIYTNDKNEITISYTNKDVLNVYEIDLVNYEIKNKNKYYVNRENKKSNLEDLTVWNIREHDNKIYALSGEVDKKYSDIYNEYIQVIDKNTREILYYGKLDVEDTSYYYLLTDEELNM